MPLLSELWKTTGVANLGGGELLMMAIGCVLLWLAIARRFEPLLLVPIGFGTILANIPVAGLSGPDGLLGMIYASGVKTGVFPLLIFMGVGALTDFSALIARPSTLLLGAAAQFGIFATLLGALGLNLLFDWNWSLKDAAAIGIIGGADGPTAIFLSSKLSPRLMGAIAVAAYSYMALVPVIQPPIMRALTTAKQREVVMTQLRRVTKLELILFPLVLLFLCVAFLPSAAPLIGLFAFGNLLRTCGVVDRLSVTVQNEMINAVTVLLGLAIGTKLAAPVFLQRETLGILLLGAVAFSIGTACGVLMGRVMYRFTGGKVNPLIGAAGVSAVPMAARVVHRVGLESREDNHLLMHAMGPNVAGVIGSATAAGVLLAVLG